MGARSCGPLRSRVPALLVFSFAFRVPAFLYNIFSRSPCLLRTGTCFAFLVYVWGWGSNSSHARCLCMDGSGRPGQLATAPLPSPPRSCVRGVRVYWREASLGSNSCLVHNRPLPPLLSVHVITVSSLHRNANIAVLFFRVPRSRIPV